MGIQEGIKGTEYSAALCAALYYNSYDDLRGVFIRLPIKIAAGQKHQPSAGLHLENPSRKRFRGNSGLGTSI